MIDVNGIAHVQLILGSLLGTFPHHAQWIRLVLCTQNTVRHNNWL